MKKVGLITFFHDDNVGTCLQAYALQTKISEMGYDVEIINYKHGDVTGDLGNKASRFSGIFRTYFNKNAFYYRKLKKSDKLKADRFQDFRKENYYLTKNEYRTFDEIGKIADEYDAFVCGSDMIWTPQFNIDQNIFFLQFCDYKKRIAYAPSFGSQTMTDDEKKDYMILIKGIRFLSCREKSGSDLIKEICGVDTKIVLDPTQLIYKEYWVNKFKLKQSEHSNKYIMCYLFSADKNYSDYYKSLEKQVADHYEADLRFMPMNRNEQVHELKNSFNAAYGPLEFMKMVYNSEFVITSSYHGLMFSLLFEKPFLVVRRDKGANSYWSQFESRFESILSEIGEDRRIVNLGEKIEESIFEIDYTKINKILNEKRKDSSDYLEDALRAAVG